MFKIFNLTVTTEWQSCSLILIRSPFNTLVSKYDKKKKKNNFKYKGRKSELLPLSKDDQNIKYILGNKSNSSEVSSILDFILYYEEYSSMSQRNYLPFYSHYLDQSL